MIGKADLGGDWRLKDHHGERRTNQDFLGQWVILYFGFSFCPDICPEQMEKLVEAVDRIGMIAINLIISIIIFTINNINIFIIIMINSIN